MQTCRIHGCGGSVHVQKHQLCSKHYDRFRKTGDPLGKLPSRWDGYEKPRCKVDGCNAVARSLGYCRPHYGRFKAHGDPDAGRSIYRQKGQGKVWHASPNGYVVRYEPTNPNAGPNGQVYQHRHVMSGIIGRPLRRHESVHHKNGNRSDNRPENLELWVKGQPSGQRIQDVAQWYLEWLLSGNLETALKLSPDLRRDLDKLEQLRKEIANG